MLPTVTIYASGWKDRDLEVDLRTVQYDGALFASHRKSHQELRTLDIEGLTVVEFRDYIPTLGETGRGYWFPYDTSVIAHLIEILERAKTSAYDKIAGRAAKSPVQGTDVQMVVRRVKSGGLDYVELRDYSKSTGVYGKGYWFPVSTIDAMVAGLEVLFESGQVPAEARRLVTQRANLVVPEDVWFVRCGGCRQAMSISPVQYSQRSTVFCSHICLHEHYTHGNDATTEAERNSQWEQLISVAGMTPLQVSRIWGIAHSLVYRTMDRLRDGSAV